MSTQKKLVDRGGSCEHQVGLSAWTAGTPWAPVVPVWALALSFLGLNTAQAETKSPIVEAVEAEMTRGMKELQLGEQPKDAVTRRRCRSGPR